MSFHNKIVVVTGGGSGIGYQIAKDLSKEGAITHILGRTKEKLLNATKNIQEEFPDARIYGHQCDISDATKVHSVFNNILQQSGPVYGLVNNAAINPSRNDILHTALPDWEATLNINITGQFYCAQAAIKQMLIAGMGSIVNISSVGGIRAFTKRTSYNTSKFALQGLSESLAVDYARNNIRVNTVCPGYVKTDLTT